MFDIVNIPTRDERAKERKDIETYKFILEAFLNNAETTEDMRKEVQEEYNKYFGELLELGNRMVD